MKFELKNICDLINEKISANELINNNLASTYVSTESMLPNKRGITKPSSIPSKGTTTAYKKDDLLVSNIRPYFKKIWSANYDGVCSNDVLVFRAKNTADANFLYYVLANDDFFVYSMATSKGTKMPRGDKASIMKYEVESFDLNTQRKIASILKPIDKKIELNNAINNNLEQQAQSIFDNMFPNISNGSCTIGDYITPKRGKSLLSKNAIFGDVPVIAGGLEPSTYHNVANTRSPVLAISASGANAGYVSLWNIPIWSSDSSYIDSSMTDDVYFWYVLLKKRQKEIFDAQTGSAQPHIYPQHIASMSVSNLDIEEVHSYTSIVTPIFEIIGHHKEENTRLASLRDTLLPKLMSGELDVSDIEI